MTLYKLGRFGGDVREHLGLADGMVDISGWGWRRSDVLLGHLRFEEMLLEGVTISPKFNDCVLRDCRFQDVKSTFRFWGAGNRWHSCIFRSVRLERPISPVNIFESCLFEDVGLIGYVPYQTLFKGCEFVGLELVGMAPSLTINETKRLDEIRSCRGTLVFEDCVFRRPILRNCSFRGVEFRNCRVEEAAVTSSSIGDAVVDNDCFSGAPSGDPFRGFLEDLREAIVDAVGGESVAARRFEGYIEAFDAGTTDKNFWRVLYETDVPRTELVRIEAVLEELQLSYANWV